MILQWLPIVQTFHRVNQTTIADSRKAIAVRSFHRRASAPPSFDAAIDLHSITTAYHAMQCRRAMLKIVTTALLVAGIGIAGFPIALQWENGRQLANTTSTVAEHVAGWPYPDTENEFKQAKEYNARLASSGQSVLGEAKDPFASLQSGATSQKEDSAATNDAEYQSLLDAGNGVMGAIRIPRISVNLPIYHGTSEESLASGSGHLYGTSLPVGGKSTHSVITGHRGLVTALMFTRLDEMKKGDFFYIEIMNETLGYEVDNISVIDPSDVSKLKIRKGEDRVTLMTCTPYGINTQRLLVSGHRVSIPEPAPDPSDLHDARNAAIMAAGATLLCGCTPIAVSRKAWEMALARHSSGNRR